VEREPHLVRVVGGPRRLHQDTIVPPPAKVRGGPHILVLDLVVSRAVLAEVEPDDIVGAGVEELALVPRRDRVVGRGGDPLQRSDPGPIEKQADER